MLPRLLVSRTYRELLVWKKAKALATLVYKETDSFPGSERFGLTSQVRRAAISIPSNIAEGQGRLTKGEFRHFLGQARGSLLELETQFAIAFDLGYLRESNYRSLDSQTYQVLGLLNRLIESLSAQLRTVETLKPAKP
jgi:four helix bundle protein